MNANAQSRIKSVSVETSPDLDRSGETVHLTEDYVGRIICHTLVVEAGVRADLAVSAHDVFIHGEVSGTLMANTVTIGQKGVVVGHLKAKLVNLAGRVNGLVHARAMGCRNGSHVEGQVLADRFERQPESVVMATVMVGPGFSERKDLVDRAERRFKLPQETVADHVVAQVAAAPKPVKAVAPAPVPAEVVVPMAPVSRKVEPTKADTAPAPAPAPIPVREPEEARASGAVPFLIR